MSTSLHKVIEASKSQPGLLAAGAGVSLAFIALLSWSLKDYHMYLSYGKGGLSYNVWGWFVSTAILR